MNEKINNKKLDAHNMQHSVHAGFRDLKLGAVLQTKVPVDKLYKFKSKSP